MQTIVQLAAQATIHAGRPKGNQRTSLTQQLHHKCALGAAWRQGTPKTGKSTHLILWGSCCPGVG